MNQVTKSEGRTAEAMLQLLSLQQHASRLADSWRQDTGISMHGLEIIIYMATHNKPTNVEIANEFGINRSMLSTKVHELVEIGYLRMSGRETDRRFRYLELTADGQRAFSPVCQQLRQAMLAYAKTADIDRLVEQVVVLRRLVSTR